MRTYLYICRLGCSNHRTGTQGPFVGRTLQCRRMGRRPDGHTPGSNRIRRGCVARLVRTPDLCWRTGTGTHNATGPGTRQGETDGREHRSLGQQRWRAITESRCRPLRIDTNGNVKTNL